MSAAVWIVRLTLPAGWVKALDKNDLTEAVGVPVSVANDADPAAVGEAWLDAGRLALMWLM